MTTPDTWTTIRGLVDWLDRENGNSDHETAMRLMKLSEETGEVMQAYIGATGQNPRKGTTHSRAEVADELCDVIVTAAVALHRFTDDPEGLLAEQLGRIAARVGVGGNRPASEPDPHTSLHSLAYQLRAQGQQRLDGQRSSNERIAEQLAFAAAQQAAHAAARHHADPDGDCNACFSGPCRVVEHATATAQAAFAAINALTAAP